MYKLDKKTLSKTLKEQLLNELNKKVIDAKRSNKKTIYYVLDLDYFLCKTNLSKWKDLKSVTNTISNLEEIQTLIKHVSDMDGNLEIDILTPNIRSHMRTVFDPDFFFGNNYTQNYIPRNVLKITIGLT